MASPHLDHLVLPILQLLKKKKQPQQLPQQLSQSFAITTRNAIQNSGTLSCSQEQNVLLVLTGSLGHPIT